MKKDSFLMNPLNLSFFLPYNNAIKVATDEIRLKACPKD